MTYYIKMYDTSGTLMCWTTTKNRVDAQRTEQRYNKLKNCNAVLEERQCL